MGRTVKDERPTPHITPAQPEKAKVDSPLLANNPEEVNRAGKSADRLSPERRSWNMARIRSKNTKPEMVVRRIVHRMGFRYRLHRADLPGKPDLVFPGRRRIVEVRSCFFHLHPGCPAARIPTARRDFWTAKLTRNVERDEENTEKLTAAGWSVLVVWECETERNLDVLEMRLREFLEGKDGVDAG